LAVRAVMVGGRAMTVPTISSTVLLTELVLGLDGDPRRCGAPAPRAFPHLGPGPEGACSSGEAIASKTASPLLGDGGQYDPVSGHLVADGADEHALRSGRRPPGRGCHLLGLGWRRPDGAPVNTGARFRTAYGMHWSLDVLRPARRPAREGVAGAWTGRSIVVFGGRAADGTFLFRRRHLYDPRNGLPGRRSRRCCARAALASLRRHGPGPSSSSSGRGKRFSTF